MPISMAGCWAPNITENDTTPWMTTDMYTSTMTTPLVEEEEDDA
jgi:hypothetical protein